MRQALQRTAVLVVVAVLTAGAVLAGCGSGDQAASNRYVSEVNRAQTDFASGVQSLAGRITPTSTRAEDRTTLARFEAAVGTVVSRLQAIRTPSKVAPLHRELVAELSGYGREVAHAAAALGSTSASQLLSARRRLLSSTTQVSSQIAATIGAINARLHG